MKKNKKSAKKRPDRANRNIRISQCMIVKDEEKNIEKALSWGRDIVWEQIVVDTGSTDRTAEIAEAMGAAVYSFEWIEDFSAAKNYAIEQAKGNWIAFLDADEFIEDDLDKVIPLIKNIDSNRDIDCIKMKMAHLDNENNVIGLGTQNRFFRNNGRVKYMNPIHEELCRDGIAPAREYDAQGEIVIYHTGYAYENQEEKEKKGARNLKLLEEQLAEKPNDGATILYMADSYNLSGYYDKALECYRRIVNDESIVLEDRVFFVRAGLQIMTMTQDEELSKKEVEYRSIYDKVKERGYNDHPDFDLFIGQIELEKGNIESAAMYYESALAKMETYKGQETMRIATGIQLPYTVIATQALTDGKLDKAVQYAIKILQTDKYSPDGIKVLLTAFMGEYKAGMDATPYWQFLLKIYQESNLKDMIFVYKFAEEVGFRSVCDIAWSVLPQEAREKLR